jgi:UDP-glucuronate decarboxylase
VYGSGNQTRTYCYAGDGIAIMLKILLEGKKGETYNVGKQSPEINVMQLANLFYESLGGIKNIEKIEYPPDYPGDEPSRRCPNVEKARTQFNVEAKTDFHVGLNIMKSYFTSEK